MLDGKVAVITGSSSGIGLGIAGALAGAGADIVLNGTREGGDAVDLARQLGEAHGIRAIYISADLSRPEQVTMLIDRAKSELGKVDILVNNAGIQHTAPVQKFPVERWDTVLAINLSSAFHGIQAVLPDMLTRNWGRIVNVASTHGLVASANKSAYVAAKHGLVGLTKTVALETATTGVTCNAICPGWVLTPLVQKQIDDRARIEGIEVSLAKFELLSEKQPSHEFVTSEQLGALAVFLCSEGASQLRGQALAVDGGWTAQ